ncbi:MAG: pyridoxamine 5'-phosphate oxidase family protein [Fulvimarina manganoxydans]|uniref:pyridoxamine 5'-phosphate oxidase family protein n=1 Tax=Fulvimarina manganoxydans TaxID=937218 RepID=UPI0023554E7E|nr:pyridoxamine 5'-phosphate oxidase family protein [Fulvimarina manganoxydans]MCK5932341.1 pyridoxamine 5'-phosphate oxidase family protein [Fulvimarina manganoxydans]
MTRHFLDITTTPSVEAIRASQNGASERFLSWPDAGPSGPDRLTADNAAFIEARDSFYMASVSETGWPYVQHRGGPRGFVKVMDDESLAFADYRGNRQYLSLGNLMADSRAALIFIDYPNRRRLKLLGYVSEIALGMDEALTARLVDRQYRAKPERILRLRIEAYDWNCPQHIVPRYTESEIAEAIRPLRESHARLEAENAALSARITEYEERLQSQTDEDSETRARSAGGDRSISRPAGNA